MTPEAERFNGWAAMLGFVAAVGAYAVSYTHLRAHETRHRKKIIHLCIKYAFYLCKTRIYLEFLVKILKYFTNLHIYCYNNIHNLF